MKIVCIGGGPAGLYFALADEETQPAPRHHRGRAQQALRHLRLGRGVFRRHHGQHARLGPGNGRRDPGRPSTTGTTSSCVQGPNASARAATVSWALAARSCSTSCRRAAKRLGVKLVFETDAESDADYPDADLIIASDGINSRIRSQHAEVFKPDIVDPPQPLHLAGHQQAVRRLHLRFRANRTRLVPGPHLQVRRQHDHLHRRMHRSHLAGPRAGSKPIRTHSIAFCEKVFADNLQGEKLMTNARHLRGSAWLNFQRVKCEQWSFNNEQRQPCGA